MKYIYRGYAPVSDLSFWHWFFDAYDYYFGPDHIKGFRLLGHGWENMTPWRQRCEEED